jgi:hypothetical protein
MEVSPWASLRPPDSPSDTAVMITALAGENPARRNAA